MNNNNLDAFYLVLMCVIFAWNSFDFFKEEQITWTIIGGLFSLLFLLSAIGAFKNIKSFLWLGIICVITYNLYAIGAIIWVLFFDDSPSSFPQSLFLLLVVAIISLININVAFKLKKRLHCKVE